MNSVMDKKGRVWIPEEMARELGIDGAVEVSVEVTDGKLVVTTGESVAEEDWDCYLPEARASYARAKRDMAEGRLYRLGPAELERLGEDPSFIDEIRSNPKYRYVAEAVAVPGA